MHLFRFFFPLFFLLPLLSLQAQPVKTPHVTAELVSEVQSIQPGQTFWVALRLDMEEHWHTYWRNPGDSGQKTAIEWILPPGFQAGEIVWPKPQILTMAGLVSYAYEGEVFLLTPITPPGGITAKEITIQAKADWLVCKEACIPGGAEVALRLPVLNSVPQANAKWKAAFETTRSQWPVVQEGWASKGIVEGQTLILKFAKPWENQNTRFIPYQEGFVNYAEEQAWNSSSIGTMLRIPLVADPILPDAIHGILWSEGEVPVEISAPLEKSGSAMNNIPEPIAVAGSPKMPDGIAGVVVAILSAFLGGLILNLMPCVFPIISIKILSFVEQAGGDRATVRKHGFMFAFGVLVSFWLLTGILMGLRAAGQEIGWGFQLQEPWVVAVLALVLFGLSLNLFGLFELGTSLIGLAGTVKNKGVADSFLSGVLATVVATPCTAPFMGAAIAYAFTAPLLVTFLVFTSLAVGLATPYVILSLNPALLQFVPKPGAWMSTFKQAMAFPMLGAVIWLLYVFGSLFGEEGVGAMMNLLVQLLLAGIAAWAYGKWHQPFSENREKWIARVVLILCALAVIFGIHDLHNRHQAQMAIENSTPSNKPTTSSQAWIPYSNETVQKLRAEGRPVFIDFTATWCFTCQVNKKIAIQTDEVMAAFADKNVALVKADWSKRNAEITRALATFGRNGVPLYVLYPADSAEPPQLLPEILTPKIILTALEKLP